MTLMTERGYKERPSRYLQARACIRRLFTVTFESKIELLKDIYAAGDLFFQENWPKNCGKHRTSRSAFRKKLRRTEHAHRIEMVRVLYNPKTNGLRENVRCRMFCMKSFRTPELGVIRPTSRWTIW
jgi:hypothetical protein